MKITHIFLSLSYLYLFTFKIAVLLYPYTVTVGEKLSYEIQWEVVPAGYLTVEVKGKKYLSFLDTYCYPIVLEAYSYPVYDLIYKVRDYQESYFDVNFRKCLGYKKNIQEGKYVKNEEVLYDYKQNKGIVVSRENTQFKISDNLLDVLTALYYFRTLEFSDFKNFKFLINDKGKEMQFSVIVHRKEKISSPVGKFLCYLLEPICIKGMTKKGKILIWLDTSVNRYPVLVKVKIPIGCMNIVLTKIERKNVK